jgi:hypothetical protein
MAMQPGIREAPVSLVADGLEQRRRDQHREEPRQERELDDFAIAIVLGREPADQRDHRAPAESETDRPGPAAQLDRQQEGDRGDHGEGRRRLLPYREGLAIAGVPLRQQVDDQPADRADRRQDPWPLRPVAVFRVEALRHSPSPFRAAS